MTAVYNNARPLNIGFNDLPAAVLPGQADVLLQRAHEAYRVGEYNLALSLCHLAHQALPNRVDILLLQGAIHYHLRNFSKCVEANHHAIMLDPHLAEAHANLANVLQQLGNLDLAIVYYKAALRLKPTFTDALNNLASAFMQKGSVPLAMEAYASALQINPNLTEVHNNLGDLWRAQGTPGLVMAQQCYLSALQVNGSYAPAWRGLGEVMRETLDLKHSLLCFKEALRHQPSFAEAYTGLGVVLKELDCKAEAEACFEAAASLKPRCALSLGNLAGICYEQAKLDRAIGLYQQALVLEPNFPEAYNNLGNTWREKGHMTEAIACYSACIQLQYTRIIGETANCLAPSFGLPNSTSVSTFGLIQQINGDTLSRAPAVAGMAPPPHISAAQASGQAQRLSVAYNNLGGILKMQGQAAPAIACYEQVVLLQPESAEAHSNLGSVYKDATHHDVAVSCYKRALGLKPDFPDAFSNLVHSLQCLEAEVEGDLAAGRLPPVQPFHAMAYPFSASLALRISQAYAEHCATAAVKLGVAPFAHPPAVPLQPGERLRIAYVSSDFGNHPLSHLMRSVFGMHDRSRVEIFCYCLSPNDGSEWRNHIEKEAEHIIDVSSWRVADIATRINADGIHIALNLNGYTKGARTEIFALKPAPVQASYMGFPATTGASYLQYLITDKVVAPPHLHHCYSESMALMPNCYFVNDFKQAHLDVLDKSKLPTRTEFGLPEDKIIFSCSNQLYKYDPQTFLVWCNILRRVTNSVLWLLRFPPHGEENIRKEAMKQGIPQERIIFTDVAAKDIHIHRSGLADVFLDTPLCNAHTTGCDVLWGGCPMVTLPLERMASREYEERAVDLGTNHPKRIALRARLEDCRLTSPLFDTHGWVRNFEKVLFRMWDIHCEGNGAHSFEV
eukprot:gene10402-8349_t